MTMFFLLNPKQYAVGAFPPAHGLPEADPIKKRHIEEVEEEPSIEEILPEITVEETVPLPVESPKFIDNTASYSLELQNHLLEYARLLEALAIIEEQLRIERLRAEIAELLRVQELEYQAKKAALAKLIAEMEEEEEAMMFLLLH